MTEVKRYKLSGARELRTVTRAGRHVVALHDPSAARTVSIEILPGELGSLRRAVADLAGRPPRPASSGTA